MATGNIVKLNVGGTVFMTRRSTLTKYDGFFKTMFESGLTLDTDEAGAIFIDRSPKHFETILNFLRDGDVDIPDVDIVQKEILREANYYALDNLIYLCGGRPSDQLILRIYEETGNLTHEIDNLRLIHTPEERNQFHEDCKKKNLHGLLIFHRTALNKPIERKALADFVLRNREWYIVLSDQTQLLKWDPRVYIRRPGVRLEMHEQSPREMEFEPFLKYINETVLPNLDDDEFHRYLGE